MTVFRNDNAWDRSNVIYANGQIVRYDKQERTPEMRYIDYGLGVLTSRIVNPSRPTPRWTWRMSTRICWQPGELAGFEVTERFYEIGSPDGLAETHGIFGAMIEDFAMNYTEQHLQETSRIVATLDVAAIERLVSALVNLRARGGRLFLLGVGGTSAANCSHAVNDFANWSTSRPMPADDVWD